MIKINEFLIAMESAQREYDMNAFVCNARNALYESSEVAHLPSNLGIDKVLPSLMEEVKLVKANENVGMSICNKGKKMNDVAYSYLGYLPSIYDEPIDISSDYFKDYNSNVNTICSKLISALQSADSPTERSTITAEAIEQLHQITRATKRQIVRTSLDIYDTAVDDLCVDRTTKYIPYTCEYMKNEIYPFAKYFGEEINDCYNQVSNLNSCVQDVTTEVRYRERAVEQACKENPELCKYLNEFLYNANQAFMDLIKFVNYAAIRKVTDLKHNAKCCKELKNRMDLIERTRPGATVIVKEGGDTDIIRTDDDIAIGKRLLDGNSDAYTTLAKNSYDFHKSLLLQIFGSAEEPDTIVARFIDEHEYDESPYNSILEITTIISAGLDKMSAMATDNIIVVDDIIESSGLAIALDAQYESRIKLLEDTSKYDSATITEVSANVDIYREILHEIKDYPKNMKTVATAIADTYKKLGILRGQLDVNLNSEFKNMQAIVELKQYLISLDEQYINFTQMIGTAMMNRLKRTVIAAEKISIHIEQERIVPFGMQTYESVDFETEASKILLDYERGLTDVMMEALHDSFMYAWNEKVRHKQYITEAEATIGTNGNNTNTQQNNNAGMNQAAAANNSAQQQQSVRNRLQALKDAIKKQFEEMLTKFRENINKMSVTQADNSKVAYGAWIEANAEALLNRSYTNVKLEILPYEKGMPFDNLLTDVQQFQGQVSGIKASEANTLKTDAAILRRLFSTKGNIQLTDDMDLAKCKSAISDALLKYYKVGNEAYTIRSYSDNELKTLVTSMVNFCKNYFGGQQEQLTTALNNISNTLQTSANGFIMEQTEYIMSKVDQIIMEEGEDQQPSTTPKVSTVETPGASQTQQGAQGNGESMSLTNMMNTLQAGCVTYSGTVCNAVRDRIVDYYKALQSLMPKQAPAQPDQNQQQQQQ